MVQPFNFQSPLASRFITTVKTGGLTNPYGLAAVYSTGKHESGWAPRNVFGEWGDPSASGKPGRAGGALSWRNERLNRLRKFAKARGDDPRRPSIETQAEFFLSEDPALVESLQNAKSEAEAQRIINKAWRFAGYDRPGGEAAQRLQTAREILSGGTGAADGMETDMAMQFGGPAAATAKTQPGGFMSGIGFTPVKEPKNKRELLAFILQNMRNEAERPNPKSLAETGLRALTQGLQGYMAGRTLSQSEAKETEKRKMLAQLFNEDDDLRTIAEAGVLNDEDLAKAWLSRKTKDVPTSVQEYEHAKKDPEFEDYQVRMKRAGRAPEKPSAREEKVRMLMETGVDRETALGIIGGRIKDSVHPATGERVLIDMATREVIPLKQPQAAEETANETAADAEATAEELESDGKTLWEWADEAAGVWPSIQRGLSGTAGQIPGALGEAAHSEEAVKANQAYRTAQRILKQALALNQKYPQFEMKQLEGILPEPGMLNSAREVRSKLEELDVELRRIIPELEEVEKDPGTHIKKKAEVRSSLRSLKALRRRLGIPEEDKDKAAGTGTTSSGVKWRIVE